jgi:succinate dehydrogenase/fumarate reductase-like Fe-S protein
MLPLNDNSFSLIFGAEAERNLIPILIHDKQYLVPRNVNLLRAFHYIVSTTEDYDLKLQKHCWAGSCENCKCRFQDIQLGEAEGLACQMDVEPNLKVTLIPRTMKRKITFGIEYNI